MIIKSISDFTNGGSLQVNDAFVIARGGLNYYLTGQALIDATSVDLSTIQTDIALLQSNRLKLDGSNGPMSGNLSLGGNKITDLDTPTLATDASNKSYVDSNFLQITGGILTGYLTLNSDPVNPLHAATKQYVDAQLSGVGAIPVDTNDLPEGTDNSAVGGGAEVDGNRYYFTNQRFDNRFSSKTTDNLAEGSINKYFTTTRFNTNFSSKTTDNLLEGSINLYYTDERVRAAISVTAPLTYDSVTGVIGLNEAALKPTFGTDNQIPFMNNINDDFDYSANLIFDGDNLALGALINSNYKLNIESSTGTIGLRSVITSNGAIGINAENTGSGTSINTGIQGSATNSSVLNIGVRGDATSVVAGDNIGGYFYANSGAGNYAVQLVDGTETLAGGKFLKDTGNGKANWANIYLADIVDYAASTANTIYTADDSLTGNRTITGSNFELLFQTMGKFSVHSHANNIDNIVFEVRSDATYHGFIVQDHNTGVHMLACRNGAVEISDAYFLPSTDGVNGQVMKTNGAGSVSFGSLFESDILDLGTYAKVGTYTDGYIPRWNSTSNTLASGSIQDNGSGNVAINTAINSNQALRITSSVGTITTYSDNSYANPTGSNFGVYGSARGTANNNNYAVMGISSNATGNNIGVSGSTGSIIPQEVNLKDIGVIGGLGSITGATLPSAGLASSINQPNNQDSYGIYINVSNPGAGNAYIGVLRDGTQGAGKVLTSDANGVATWQTPASGGIANIVEDTTPQLGGTLDANGFNIDMGVNLITDTKVGQWDLAYGWGDHSTAGYALVGTYTNGVIPRWNATTNTLESGTIQDNGTFVDVFKNIGTNVASQGLLDSTVYVTDNGASNWYTAAVRGYLGLNSQPVTGGSYYGVIAETGSAFNYTYNEVAGIRSDAKSVYNHTDLYGIVSNNVVVGAASTVTNAAFLKIGGILVEAGGAVTNKYGIYQTGTDLNSFNGNIKANGSQIWSQQRTSALTITTNAATYDCNDSNGQVINLNSATGAVTLTFTNMQPGGTYFLKVIQNAVTPYNIGTYTVAGGSVKFPGGTPPTISTGAAAIDTIVFYYDGVDLLGNYGQDYQ